MFSSAQTCEQLGEISSTIKSITTSSQLVVIDSGKFDTIFNRMNCNHQIVVADFVGKDTAGEEKTYQEIEK